MSRLAFEELIGNSVIDAIGRAGLFDPRRENKARPRSWFSQVPGTENYWIEMDGAQCSAVVQGDAGASQVEEWHWLLTKDLEQYQDRDCVFTIMCNGKEVWR